MTEYKDLSYLVGKTVTVSRNLNDRQIDSGDFFEPDRITVIAEYPKTILLKIDYGRNSFRRMITKAAMYCGDERISYNGHLLTGREVR